MCSLRADSFSDPETQILRNEGRDPLEEEVVEGGTSLAADFDYVFETAGGDQCDARSFSLQEGIGSDGGAVQENQGGPGANFQQSFADGARGITGSREDFESSEFSLLKPDAIGESASCIDGDPDLVLAATSHESGRVPRCPVRNRADRVPEA